THPKQTAPLDFRHLCLPKSNTRKMVVGGLPNSQGAAHRADVGRLATDEAGIARARIDVRAAARSTHRAAGTCARRVVVVRAKGGGYLEHAGPQAMVTATRPRDTGRKSTSGACRVAGSRGVARCVSRSTGIGRRITSAGWATVRIRDV